MKKILAILVLCACAALISYPQTTFVGGRSGSGGSGSGFPVTSTQHVQSGGSVVFDSGGGFTCAAGSTCNAATATNAYSSEQPVTNVTDPAWGVSAAGTAAANQTAFAAVAAAVNAGSTPPVVYIPYGTYQCLSTGSTCLGAYTVPVIIEGAGSMATIINHTGTGELVDFGPTGHVSTSVYPTALSEIKDLGVIGGGSGSNGIVFEPFIYPIHIHDLYFLNYGNSSSYAIYGTGPNILFVNDIRWWTTDGATGHNFLYHGNPTGYLWSEDSIHDNYLDCSVSTSNPNTTLCGVGIWETEAAGLVIAHNFISGPCPDIRLSGASSGTGGANIHDNAGLENFCSPSGSTIELGPTGTTTQTVTGLNITDSTTYFNSTSDSLVGPVSGNPNVTLSNANISNNIARTVSSGYLLSSSLATSGTVNTTVGNINFTPTGGGSLGGVWAYTNRCSSAPPCSFGTALTNGSQILVAIQEAAASNVTPSDTATNSFSDSGAGTVLYNASATKIVIFCASNTHTTATDAIAAVGASWIYAQELTGSAHNCTLDGTSGVGYSTKANATGGAAGANTMVATSLTPVTNGDLILSFFQQATGTPSLGTIPIAFLQVSATYTNVEGFVQATAAAIAPTAGNTSSSAGYGNITLALQP